MHNEFLYLVFLDLLVTLAFFHHWYLISMHNLYHFPPQVLVHNILKHQLVLIVSSHKDVTLKIEANSTSQSLEHV
jgi:hypothetical protein